MSKFEIGDRVRKVKSLFLRDFDIGTELIVVGGNSAGFVRVAKESQKEAWDIAYDADLELILPAKPDTITLTRYIKPATIEINGVEYIMPEKNDVA